MTESVLNILISMNFPNNVFLKLKLHGSCRRQLIHELRIKNQKIYLFPQPPIKLIQF
jgi:hypothetical protein